MESVRRLQTTIRESGSPKTLESDIRAWIKPLRSVACSTKLDTRTRASAVRALRSIVELCGPAGGQTLNKMRVHLATVRALDSTDHVKHSEERLQALKLVRAQTRATPKCVPRTLVRSVVGIASHMKDPLRECALETLREFVLLDVRTCVETGVVAALLNAVLDPSVAPLADAILLTILKLLNDPETRAWLRPAIEVGVLLSPFTNPGDAPQSPEKRAIRLASRKAIVTLLRTWTGLFVLASDPQGLRSLVQVLVQPVAMEVRHDALETILEIFDTINPLRVRSVPRPPSSTLGFASHGSFASMNPDSKASSNTNGGNAPSRAGRGFYGTGPYMAEFWGVGPGAAGSKELAAGGFHAERVPGRHAHTHTLLDNYLVMVLLAFVECGLVEALVELGVTAGPSMSRTATQLLSFVSRFSTRLLPGSVSRRLLSQRQLLATAVNAARSGDVQARGRAQRAANVIGFLSRIVGSGYDTALATLLARSTYEDGIALASELALAGSVEAAQLNMGVFPRSIVVSLPSVVESLAAVAKSVTTHANESKQPAQQTLPRTESSSSMLRRSVHKLTRRLSLTSRRASASTTTPPASPALGATTAAATGGASEEPPRTPTRAETKATEAAGSPSLSVASSTVFDASLLALSSEDQTVLAAPLVANRGHRRLVQQLVLTDVARGSSHHGELSEDLKRLMDRARILVKTERREWRNWDWVAIEEILSGPCQIKPVCHEILVKTKFFKRLAAFYSVTANGAFASMPWEPDAIAYTNVAVSMFRVLLDMGSSADEFLNEDPRGSVLKQISDALECELAHTEFEAHLNETSEVTSAQSAGAKEVAGDAAGVAFPAATDPFRYLTQQLHKGLAPQSAPALADEDARKDAAFPGAANRVFTPAAVELTMTRDLFVLLGVFASHERGVHYLTKFDVFNKLKRLSAHRDKDYLLRLVISHFDYNVGPASERCRQWLQVLMIDKMVSSDLRRFCIGFLRSALRSVTTARMSGVSQWTLGVIFAQLQFPEVSEDALSVLIEAAHYPHYLEVMIGMFTTELRPYRTIMQQRSARPLLLKFLGTKQGVEVLSKEGWLDTLLSEWSDVEYVRYTRSIETALTLELGVHQRAGSQPGVVPIPVRAHEASALSEPGFSASELQWLFRMPWRVEVWAESPTAGRVPVPMDAFIDCSSLRPEARFDESSSSAIDEGRGLGVCVTAVPPFSRSRQGTKACIVPEDATLYACLCLANQPVDKRGRTSPQPSGGGSFPPATPWRAETGGSMTMIKRPMTSRTLVSTSAGRERTRGATSRGLSDPADEARRGSVDDASPGQVDAVRPLNDANFWTRCTPMLRKGSRGQEFQTKSVESLCSSGSASVFRLTKLDAASARRVSALALAGGGPPASPPSRPAGRFGISARRSKDVDDFSDTSRRPSAGSDGADLDIRTTINPLIAMIGGKSRAPSSVVATPVAERLPGTPSPAPSPPTSRHASAAGPGAAAQRSEAVPLVALSEVRFFLELVPHRSAAPSFPVHILGELAKTDVGARVMREAGLIPGFVDLLRSEASSLPEKRAALWALGHAGSSAWGFRLLDKSHVALVVEIATRAACLSLRGTAIYALGLFSRSPSGRLALHAQGWATLDARSHPFATVAVPESGSVFNLHAQEAKHVPAWTGMTAALDGVVGPTVRRASPAAILASPGVPNETSAIKRVLPIVSNMSNKIALRKASSDLLEIFRASPALFADVKLFLAVHELLARFVYSSSARQNILGLFHGKIAMDSDEFWSLVEAEAYS